MRPAEISVEAIIEAGKALQAAGRNVTGFALRQKVGGGNPSRLRQVWDESIANIALAQAQPVADLPIEVADEVASITKSLSERISTLAIGLNDKTVKAAERRVAEVLRAAAEQRDTAERELADAANTVEELENQQNELRAEISEFQAKQNTLQARNQALEIEIAQLRERSAEQRKQAATETLRITERMNKAEADRDAERKLLVASREECAKLTGMLEALKSQLQMVTKALGERGASA